MKSYSERIAQAITAALKNTPCTFEELVRRCQGAYPTLVEQELKKMNAQSLLTTIYTLPEDSPGNDNDSAFGQAATMSVTLTIENNPVLSSWYYSWKTCQKVSLLDSWQNKRVLFLGTPRLFEYFALSGKTKENRLIDLDATLTNELKKKFASDRSIIEHQDINSLDDAAPYYDAVFFDPPWYLESYKSWLTKAINYVKQDGVIFFPLFPNLTRPAAEAERKEILALCKKLANTVFSIADFFEYDIPSFEKQQLKEKGISLFTNWKIADLIVLKDFNRQKELAIPPVDTSYSEWTEFQLFDTRWFLRTRKDDRASKKGAKAPLVCSISDSRFLDSPSRRNPQLKKANLLSSKGHALYVDDPKRFLSVVDLIQEKDSSNTNVEGTLLQAHEDIRLLREIMGEEI